MLTAGFRVYPSLRRRAARLLKAYTVQLEALRKLRYGGSRHVRVEHVHINEGGRAVIGNVSRAGKH